jgi:hypothetical protein
MRGSRGSGALQTYRTLKYIVGAFGLDSALRAEGNKFNGGPDYRVVGGGGGDSYERHSFLFCKCNVPAP